MSRTGPVRALGAMSGTSLDGVDAAVVETDGHRILEFGETGYRAYGATERAVLRAALGQWPGEPGVADAAAVVAAAHAQLLRGFEDVDLVGFHGQTLAHEPRGRGTHQAGDGKLLASGSWDKTLRVWNAQSGRQTRAATTTAAEDGFDWTGRIGHHRSQM